MAQHDYKDKDLKSLRYLLNQSIREYDIPVENYHVSTAALELWKKITKKDIRGFHYRDVVVCDALETPISVDLYNGASKEGEEKELIPNDSFLFNEIFHEDHIIPVSLILNEIVKMDTFDENSIKAKLDKMHLCVILKEEDRKLGRTKERSLNFEENKKDVYEAKGIKIIDFNQIEKQLLCH